MKNILVLLSVALSVTALSSVSYAGPPPGSPRLSKIEKAYVATVEVFAPCAVLECRDAFTFVKVFAEVPASCLLQELRTQTVSNAAYVLRYGYQARSRSNYWQGPPPYGNA